VLTARLSPAQVSADGPPLWDVSHRIAARTAGHSQHVPIAASSPPWLSFGLSFVREGFAVTEIFLAYDSSDRERVRPVRDALAAHGLDVQWDLEPPTGVEWETWVRRRLARCRCVVVLRSAASLHSNRMSHVAAVAREHGKLVMVRLERGALGQTPPGPGADSPSLADWSGEPEHPGWQELCRRIDTKLKASLWVQRLMHDVETERTRWRAQYETSAARCRSLNDELAAERSERGAAQDKAAGLQAQLDGDAKARFRLEARIVELEQRLARAEEKHAEAGQLLREELHQMNARLTDAQAALERAQDEAARLRVRHAAVEGEHAELRSCVATHEATIGERESRIAGLDARIAARDADVAGLKAGIAQRDAAVAGLQAAVVQRDGALAGLQTNVARRDADIADLKAGIAERDSYMSDLEASVSQRDAYIAELVASVTERDTWIADLRASLADRHAYLAGLEASIAQRDTHIADLKTSIAEQDSRIAGLRSTLYELERRPRGLFAAGAPLPAALSRVTRPVLGRLGSR
jgi:predicted  nucleic acid-binding Zn-ribbon protein